MNKRYKQVFKDEVIKDMKDNNLSVHQLAKKYKISPKSVYAWLDKKDPELKKVLKENRQLKAENNLMVQLIKKLAVDSKKKWITGLLNDCQGSWSDKRHLLTKWSIDLKLYL